MSVYSRYLFVEHFGGIIVSLSEFTIRDGFNLLVIIFLGMLFGIEHLINIFKKKGKWTYDLPRFLILGTPFLLLAFEPIHFNLLRHIGIPTFTLVAPGPGPFLGMFAGYIMITSLNKK